MPLPVARGLLMLLGVLAGCAGTPERPPAAYVVRAGDTLSGIARRYGLDYRDIARWNGLPRPDRIFAGQVLRLDGTPSPTRGARPSPQPAPHAPSVPSDPAPAFLWPVAAGIATHTERPNGGQGLTVAGVLGQPIRAAAAGEIVYVGTGLLGLGQLLVIKHNDTWLTAYAHTLTAQVVEGQRVEAGQAIATMGMGPGRQPMLYFEIRERGRPVDPRPRLQESLPSS